MDLEFVEKLEAEIDALTKRREEYLIQSSHNLGIFDGRIAMLRDVLALLSRDDGKAEGADGEGNL